MEPRKPHLVDTSLAEPGADDVERLIDINYIRNDLGGVTTMTVWRWSRDPDPEVRFPAPDLMISGKKRLWFLWRYRAWKARVIARGAINTPRERRADQELPPAA